MRKTLRFLPVVIVSQPSLCSVIVLNGWNSHPHSAVVASYVASHQDCSYFMKTSVHAVISCCVSYVSCVSDSAEIICVRWSALHSDPPPGALVSLPLVFNPWPPRMSALHVVPPRTLYESWTLFLLCIFLCFLLKNCFPSSMEIIWNSVKLQRSLAVMKVFKKFKNIAP